MNLRLNVQLLPDDHGKFLNFSINGKESHLFRREKGREGTFYVYYLIGYKLALRKSNCATLQRELEGF